MKHLSLLLFLLPAFSFAQEFAQPDSAAIIKAHVKSVKIYYTGTGSTHLISGEKHYDKLGRTIYSSDGTSSYYNSYSYTQDNQLAAAFTRTSDGKIMNGQTHDYSHGKLVRINVFADGDSIHPVAIATFDSVYNITREDIFANGKLSSITTKEFDAAKNVIHEIDSFPGSVTREYLKKQEVRNTFYKGDTLQQNCRFYYSHDSLSKVLCTAPGITNSYTIKYSGNASPEIIQYGQPLTRFERTMWMIKFGHLLPASPDLENPLPYSDPVPENNYKHTLTRDRRGNITKDHVTGAEAWMNFQPVDFTYEYEYW